MKYILFFLIFFSSLILPQELNCKVTVNYEGLPVVNRESLRDFAQVIENYINKTRFLSSPWEGEKIDCNINIYFLSAADEITYTAQVFVGSRRPVYNSIQSSQILSLVDNTWNFSYQKGQSLYANQTTFDPITSFLDFYALLIIGFDGDTFGKLGGTPYFQRAFDISNLAASSKFNTGWLKTTSAYNRKALVEELLSEKFRLFRESIFNYHYNGIDLMATEPVKAIDQIVNLIKVLDNIRLKQDLNSVFVKTFFDAKNGEIAEKLKDYSDKEIFNTLKKIDPSHATKYDEVKGKK